MKRRYCWIGLLLCTLIPSQVSWASTSTPNSWVLNRPGNLGLAKFLSGFYEIRYRKRQVNPLNATGTLLSTIQNDPAYKKLPIDVLAGQDKIDMVYRVDAEGKLDDHVSVAFHVEQEPDFPMKTDIKVKIDRSTLTFGKFDSVYNGGEFFNLTRSIDGVNFASYDENWQGQLTQGQMRSDPKKLELTGNGGNKVQLANTNILEGSVKVVVNNVVQAEGVDYKVNYYTGEIIFTTVKTADQVIKIIYEFTDPISDFIPILSAKTFTGAQYRFAASSRVETQRSTADFTQVLWPTDDPAATSTVFYLENTPIVAGSEVVKLNKAVLRPNIDYSIDINSGKLALIGFGMQIDDLLQVSYSYYPSVSKKGKIGVIANRQLYEFSDKNIVVGSVSVKLGTRTLSELLDYKVDYEKGKIQFMYPINQYREFFVEYRAFQIKSIKQDTRETPFEFGITYGNEFNKIGGNASAIAVVNETPSLNGTTSLFARHAPIINTDTLKFTRNGIAVSPSDFLIDTYSGEITPTGFLVSPGDTYTLAYTYRKLTSIFEYTPGNANGSPIYNSDTLQLSHPVAYRGIDSIELRQKNGQVTILGEGKEYSVSYEKDGRQFLTITMVKQDGSNSSVLTQYPGIDDQLKINYKYAIESSLSQDNVNQRVIDLTAKAKVNPNWVLESEFAMSENNLSRPVLSGKSEMAGTGQDTNQTYTLANKNLVDNSESVYVNQVLMTRDTDYYISYEQGTVKFRNRTLGSSDQIRVQYDYYGDGTVESGALKSGTAFRVSSNYQVSDRLTIGGSMRRVDKSFVPLGSIADSRGSSAYGIMGNWKYSDNSNESVGFNYAHSEVFVANNDDSKPVNKVEDTIGTSVVNYILNNQIRTTHQLNWTTRVQNSLLIQDPTHPIDTQIIGYEGNAMYGVSANYTQATIKLSSSTDDFLDRIAIANDTSRVASIFGHYEPTVYNWDQVILNPYVSFGNRTTSSSNVTALTDNNNYGVKADVTPFKALKIRWNTDVVYSNSLVTTVTSQNQTTQTITNQLAQVDFTPYSWIDLGYANTINENRSPLVDQKGSSTIETIVRVKRFVPYDAADDGVKAWVPWSKGAVLTYQNANWEYQSNNGNVDQKRNTGRIGLASAEPISGVKINSTSYEYGQLNAFNLVQTTTVSQNYSTQQTKRRDLDLTVNLPYPLFNMVTYGYVFSDREDHSESIDYTAVTTNNMIHDIPDQSVKHQANVNFGTVTLPIWFTPMNIPIGDTAVSATHQLYHHNDVQTYTYTNRLNNSQVVSQSVDVRDTRQQTYGFSTNPYQIRTDGSFGSGHEYYNRNINSSAIGSLFSDTDFRAVTVSARLWDGLSGNANWSKSHFSQYSSPTINITDTDLESQYLTRQQQSRTAIGGSLQYTPFTWISFVLGVNRVDIDSEFITANQDVVTNSIVQMAIASGIIYHIWKDCDLSYDYSIKKLTQGDNAVSYTGYSGLGKLVYLPVNGNDLKASVLVSIESNWGYGLNDLDVDTLKQASNQLSLSSIRERNDTVSRISININATISVPQIPQISSLTVVGEGESKRIMDYIVPGNSYDITGISLKAHAEF